jgi:transcriptional regulator with GAF, ATPase, and Fis domain
LSRNLDTGLDTDETAAFAPETLAPALNVIHSVDPRLAGCSILIGDGLAIGRSDGTGLEVGIEDTKVSRRHATLARAGDGRFVLEDHGSTNGTFVDGARVRRAALELGAVVRIGESLFELGLEERPVEPEAELVARSTAFSEVVREVDRVAAGEMTVLILGETGAGKELVARRLHQRSGRPGPLVAINCGAIPSHLAESVLFGHKKGAFTDATADAPGHFGMAQGGTLFLDEIGALPPELQPKLLRVLESREYAPVGASAMKRSEARVVAATNLDLRAEAMAGRFRADLYARVAELTITVPPLRERRTDIPALARSFLAAFAPGRELALTTSFVEALVLHDWPLNVRELRAVMRRVSLLDPSVTALRAAHLPPEVRPREAAPAADAGEPPTKEALEKVLEQMGGNVAQVAQHYGRSRMQLYRWLMKYGIEPASFRH